MQDNAMTNRNCTKAHLSDRGVLRVGGADAKDFLQGLVTSDMERVVEDRSIHAGLLTPQGKILFDFFVVGDGTDYLLECPKAQASDLAVRLTFYKLRAAVEITDICDRQTVWAAWGDVGEIEPPAVAYSDPRLKALGVRFIAAAESDGACARCAPTGEDAYHAHRIAHGVPEGGRDFDYGDAFPHEADFDQLHGIDFEKGCFVGQEVVSRMEHRGTARKRVVPVAGNGPLGDQGGDVVASGVTIGRLRSVSHDHGLALLRLDRAKKALAQGQTITAGGVPIRLLQPAWASFEVPRAGAATPEQAGRP